MRKLKTDDILGLSKGMPTKAGIWEHLQNAYTEMFAALVQFLNGGNDLDPTKMYVIYGCIDSNPAVSDYDISAGLVYFNGELFFVKAASFTAAGTAVAKITTDQYSALDSGLFQKGDPFLFTDGNNYDILDIRTINIVDDLSGSGDADYADFVFDLSPVWKDFTPSIVDGNNAYAPIALDADYGSRYKVIGKTLFLQIVCRWTIPSAFGSNWILCYVQLPPELYIRHRVSNNRGQIGTVVLGATGVSICEAVTFSTSGAPGNFPNDLIGFVYVGNMTTNNNILIGFGGQKMTINASLIFELE